MLLCNVMLTVPKAASATCGRTRIFVAQADVSLKHGNQLAVQGLLGESKWRRPVCLVLIYQFLVFCCENVVLGICNVPSGN